MLSADRCMHIINQSLLSIHQVSAISRNLSAQGVCTLNVAKSSVNGLGQVFTIDTRRVLGHPRSLAFTRLRQEHINGSQFTIAAITNKIQHNR